MSAPRVCNGQPSDMVISKKIFWNINIKIQSVRAGQLAGWVGRWENCDGAEANRAEPKSSQAEPEPNRTRDDQRAGPLETKGLTFRMLGPRVISPGGLASDRARTYR